MKQCSKCGRPHSRAGQRYCKDCHAAYMRAWRKTHPLSPQQRRDDICRSYTHVLIKRGKLVRQPCEQCGAEPAQAHHPDLSNPRLVAWLCIDHHRQHHRELRAARADLAI